MNAFQNQSSCSERRDHIRLKLNLIGQIAIDRESDYFPVRLRDISDNGISFYLDDGFDIENRNIYIHFEDVVRGNVFDLDIDWSEATKKTLADKIAFCIGVLTDAIYRLAIDENGNPNPAFTDESLWHNSPSDTPVGMVIGSLQGSSALIKDGVNIIQEIKQKFNNHE